MNRLCLHLKREYFDAIKSGEKAHEFRLAEKWESRIAGKNYHEIYLFCGYPPRGDQDRVLRRAWNGFHRRTITHPHFGPNPVDVLAIDVTRPL